MEDTHIGNILDPVQDRLDKRIFDYKTPKPSVIQFVKRVYYRALSQKFHISPADASKFVKLVLTGSLTTYQYSDTSDMDVSVFPDWERFQALGYDIHDVRQALVEMNIDHLDGTALPGSPHPLQFFTVAPGVTPDIQFKPGLRSGFDLDTLDWIVPPEESRSKTIAIQYPDVFERASEIADKMKMMLDNGDAPRAIELWKQVHKKRQEEQRAGGGDYSEGNIVYKWLVHEGLVDRLRNELGLQIATHVKQSVEWGNDLDPRILDNRDTPTIEAWTKLEQQVIQLAQTYDVHINWLRRDQVERSNYEVVHYQAPEREDGSLDWQNVQFKLQASFPHITGEHSYFAALHELGHCAFQRLYNDPLSSNSFEEENWAWHFALENAQVPFSEETLEWGKTLLDTYDHPNYGYESDSWPGWFKTYDHRQINQERAEGQQPPMNLNYPLYSAVDYSDGLGIRGPSEKPYEFKMPLEVEQNFVSRMECPFCQHNLRNIDGQIYCEYCGWQPRIAMADRTGNPQIDALIEEFLQTPMGEWTTDNLPIDALRDPEQAHGMCEMVTEQFVEFAKQRGFKAYVTQTDLDEMGYKPSIEPFGEVGFDENDEMQYGFYPEHTIATIVIDDPSHPYGREFYIDFAASQYGYTDHPKVTSASLMHIMYDFEKDRITLGSKDADVHSKMIGNYNASDNAATLFEAERQWINPTYFRRLWNYSFPNYPLKSVMFQAGETTHTLKTREHPYHERHLD